MKRKILIVEDNVGLSQIQKDWLSRAGYDAVTAMSEPIARSLIRKTQFDLILSDVRLPEGDGISLLPFHANLVQAAISADAPVVPVGLRFVDDLSGDTSLALEDFLGEPCWIGMDLAEKRDFAALVLDDERVQWVKVTLTKPGAVPNAAGVGVEILRHRTPAASAC